MDRCSAITALHAASLASCAAVSGRFGRSSFARLTRSSYSRCAAAPAAERPTPEARSASSMRAVLISGGGAAKGPCPSPYTTVSPCEAYQNRTRAGMLHQNQTPRRGPVGARTPTHLRLGHSFAVEHLRALVPCVLVLIFDDFVDGDGLPRHLLRDEGLLRVRRDRRHLAATARRCGGSCTASSSAPLRLHSSVHSVRGPAAACIDMSLRPPPRRLATSSQLKTHTHWLGHSLRSGLCNPPGAMEGVQPPVEEINVHSRPLTRGQREERTQNSRQSCTLYCTSVLGTPCFPTRPRPRGRQARTYAPTAVHRTAYLSCTGHRWGSWARGRIDPYRGGGRASQEPRYWLRSACRRSGSGAEGEAGHST